MDFLMLHLQLLFSSYFAIEQVFGSEVQFLLYQIRLVLQEQADNMIAYILYEKVKITLT